MNRVIALLAGVAIIAMGALIFHGGRRLYHWLWVRYFLRRKAFRPIPSQFLDGKRSTRDRYPQDHP